VGRLRARRFVDSRCGIRSCEGADVATRAPDEDEQYSPRVDVATRCAEIVAKQHKRGWAAAS
jgi:hypothetical protein